jgi:hypothetical protein
MTQVLKSFKKFDEKNHEIDYEKINEN